MTVQELEDMLAQLPADMLVMVGDMPWRAHHLQVIHTQTRGTVTRVDRVHRCETGRCSVGYDTELVQHPPYVALAARLNLTEDTLGLAHDPPPVRKLGKFYWLTKARNRK